MASATLSVRFAGPLVTFQDGGRTGHMRFGVPASGPMDPLAFAAANAALGNPLDATTVEVSMGGIALGCAEAPVTVAIAGGGFSVDQSGRKHAPWTVLTLQPGDKLTLRPGDWGSWCYLAVSGRLDAATWLGHTATHSMSGFGGGAIATGASIAVQDAEIREAREGDIPIPDSARPTGVAHVVMGPQEHRFESGATDIFLNGDYSLTDAYDRMGVRLQGPALPLGGSLSIPSEPILRGSVQVSGDGVPTVLLADHQTTGGYPKIATVVSADAGRMAQLRARDPVRFRQVSAAEAVGMARDHAAQTARYLAEVAIPSGSLAQRLMTNNLISGVFLEPATRPSDEGF